MSSLRILAGLGVIAALYFGSFVIIPVILSTFLFLLLDPMVNWAEKKRVPRVVSALLVVVFFMGLAGLAGWGAYSAVGKIAEEVPAYSSKVRKIVASFQKQAQKIEHDTHTLLPKSSTAASEDVQKVQVVQGTDGWTSFMLKGLGSAFGFVANLFLIPILTFLLLLEKNRLVEHFSVAVHSSLRSREVWRQIMQMVHGFFIGNFLVGLGTAVIFFGIFSWIGLESKVALALTSGFLNLIPLAGALLIMIFPLAQALLQFDTAGPFLAIMGSSLFIHLFVANFILPKVIGPRINVNAVAATVGLVFWGWAWGAIGVLLAIPLTALVKIFAATQSHLKPLAYMITEDMSELESGVLNPNPPGKQLNLAN